MLPSLIVDGAGADAGGGGAVGDAVAPGSGVEVAGWPGRYISSAWPRRKPSL